MIYDAIVIGAGLAGLECAKLLSRQGAKILLVDRKNDLSTGVHTTGIFVRKTLEDFEFPPRTLGPAVRDVSLYSPRLKLIELNSEHEEFRVGKMGDLYRSLLDECLAEGVEFSGSTRYLGCERSAELTDVELEKNGSRCKYTTKVLIGADGARSRVAKDLGLDENSEWIVGYEEVFHAKDRSGTPRLHCFLDAELAPGYLAWIADDGEEIHIGVGGYPSDFNPREALRLLKEKTKMIVDLSDCHPLETRGGRIPVGGVLRRIACEHGILIGDAAGAVSPLTAGGLDPAIRLSHYAAGIVAERLRTGNASDLLRFSGAAFRTRFVSRLWMRRLIRACTSQRLLELGVAFLRTKIGTKFAKHVFFGRGSFPDPDDLPHGIGIVPAQGK